MKSSLTTALLLLVLSPFAAAAAQAQDNAGLFFYGPAPTVETITRLAGEASVSTEQDGAVTRVTVVWPEVSVVLNIDPDWHRDEQLSGIRGLLSGFPARERSRAEVKLLLANLDRTTTCYGSVIEPGYDRDGKVSAFFRKLIEPTGGFLFTFQSFYSSDGRRITGLQDDPAVLP